MIGAIARHRVQVLRAAAKTLKQIVAETEVSQSSVQRIEREPAIEQPAGLLQAGERGIGRPSVVEEYRDRIPAVFAPEPQLSTVEILHQMRGQGYAGGKSALYGLACELRPKLSTLLVRFEAVAGEFLHHDFGQVEVRYLNGTHERIRFFVSRLKYSRWVDAERSQRLEWRWFKCSTASSRGWGKTDSHARRRCRSRASSSICS